jgi:hypothetical protein
MDFAPPILNLVLDDKEPTKLRKNIDRLAFILPRWATAVNFQMHESLHLTAMKNNDKQQPYGFAAGLLLLTLTRFSLRFGFIKTSSPLTTRCQRLGFIKGSSS